ncbi:MAG TPA: hypothetical protein VK638_22100 [Edaphobacter sp.]|nr:hypothetical protein [Edaphobacter sp.]
MPAGYLEVLSVVSIALCTYPKPIAQSKNSCRNTFALEYRRRFALGSNFGESQHRPTGDLYNLRQLANFANLSVRQLQSLQQFTSGTVIAVTGMCDSLSRL